MHLQAAPLHLAGRIAVSTIQWRTCSMVRQYSNHSSNRVTRLVSADTFSKNWKLATGAAAAVAGVIFVFAPSQRETRQSNNISDTKKSNSENGEATGQCGLQPNAEQGRGDLDSRHNTQKGNTVELYPDAKGGQKKKISSQAGMKQGTIDKAPTSGYEGVEDKAAASKPPGGRGMISGKQEGLSNTDTKYSIDLTNTPEKSQKGEGTPESSKSKGTVDVKRPLAQ